MRFFLPVSAPEKKVKFLVFSMSKTHIQIAGINQTDVVLRNLAYFWGLKRAFLTIPARHSVLIDLSEKQYSRLLMNAMHSALRVVSAISNQLYKNIKGKIISNGNSLFQLTLKSEAWYDLVANVSFLKNLVETANSEKLFKWKEVKKDCLDASFPWQ